MKFLFEKEKAKQQIFKPIKNIPENEEYDKNLFIEYSFTDMRNTPELYYDSEKDIIREFVEDDYIRLGVFDKFGLSTVINGEKINYPKSCELMMFDFDKKKYIFDEEYFKRNFVFFINEKANEYLFNTLYTIKNQIDKNILFYIYFFLKKEQFTTRILFSNQPFKDYNNSFFDFFNSNFIYYDDKELIQLYTSSVEVKNEEQLINFCKKINDLFKKQIQHIIDFFENPS